MTSSKRTGPQSLGQIFGMPALLALASLAGLIIGLTGEGWRDVVTFVLLLWPVALFLRHWLRRG